MRFFFYSLEHLPMHIQVIKGEGSVKFEINPVKLVESNGMRSKDIVLAEALIKERKAEIIKRWEEVHGE
jgi:hypothetical protein